MHQSTESLSEPESPLFYHRVTLGPRDARDAASRHPAIAVVEDSGVWHVDISIVEPTSRHAVSSSESSATTKGAAAAYMEQIKINKYSKTEWLDTVPLILDGVFGLPRQACRSIVGEDNEGIPAPTHMVQRRTQSSFGQNSLTITFAINGGQGIIDA